MIVEWILSLGTLLLTSLCSTLPVITVPSWLSSTDSVFSTVFSAAGSMGVWFPAPLLVTVLTAVLAFWLIGFTVKLARMVLSFFTAGGGSAG
jgi:hypothetical protein